MPGKSTHSRDGAPSQYDAAHSIATIYAALGDADQTFAWLDRALEDRGQLLGWVRWNPVFDFVREDPRYTDFMRRLKLPL